ncbi:MULTISPECIES: DNA repair protein RecN [unclassified Bosea (in: a-proteobacteria)]|uniref:DNA repair protein RecN n=1 Tax=unclassified Bosea (in: a-proteobacteria) TaxID=2653178 RepID=UPI000F761CD6|nr:MULTISPECIES: DNA repair protein RecN [unclassified Bosea (in: a-proteobacteria)]AZO76403.1 DNA repair protein RecN [Bosea sp. Tri-49]RXT26330.1 DNA repair protein RecN [Bosea sp. Tri-39]RXT31571.1 DNA repair protein RecN [Bosea sp. Tri-54]
MLAQLSIRDIVLIDRLDLGFEDGLSVLTGETGAGKSILLDGFALALGSRGDGGLVRHGESQGQVSAVFDLPMSHPARALAQAQEIDTDGDLILRRVQYADGRTRAFVNDQPVSVQILRMIGAALVEIHGQHDDRALTDPAQHRTILDGFGELAEQAAEVARASETLKKARQALQSQRMRVETARKEADFLRHAVAELGKLAPGPGEEEALASQRQGMMAAEKVARDIIEAYEAVGGTASPVSALSGVLRRLERRAAQAPELVDPSIAALTTAVVALEEAGETLQAAVRAAEFDPRVLERVEERLFALRAAARKFDVPVDALPALAETMAADLAALDESEGSLKRLEAELAEAEAAYVALATTLSAGRIRAASALDAAVKAELPPLKLERARFITQIDSDPDARGPEGFDRVEFWVETNPGTRPGPMMKVASGGELSRFMLALKVVLAERGSAPTLVFDEIDTGVGGAVADAIGERLARLAARVQVVSVTHAPQVAAKAGQHFLIAKSAHGGEGADERTVTRVSQLEAGSRREEIARMLAGASITEEARAAAGKLLDAAGLRG